MNKWWKMERIGAFDVGDGFKRRIQVMYLGIPEGFVMNLRPKLIHTCANHEFPKL